MSTDAATLPDALSDAARSFAAGPHRLVIGAERPEAADGRTFETIDPATGRVITEVPYAGVDDVDRAVRAAREAFDDGRWSHIAAAERTRAMLAFADAIDANADELAQLESLDNGKPVKMARRVDVPLASAHIRYFAGWPTRITGEVLPVAQPNMHCYTRKEPVGVAGQIIPWNFPLLMAAWKVAPALAAGCTIVLKPAEQTPLTALRLGELAREAGIPEGVLNVITGDGETGAALVDHPDVDKIAFTGSTAVGREIGGKAGQALKRVTLELGGKSPNIILPDADLNAAVKGAYQAIYYNTGQACNAGSRLFVHKDQYDDVLSGLAEAAGKARLG
jgi:acyl-CoA reductase-like NAD-dependent aldehyde dehydrogenase